MRGTLSINKVEKNIFSLTIYDVLGHLDNLDKVEFIRPTEVDRGYFDIINQVYSDAFTSGQQRDKILLDEFYKAMQKLFSDQNEEVRDKLISLGATDIDFALINYDKPNLVKIAFENTETDIYQLAKNYRFLDIAKVIHSDFNPYAIDITIGCYRKSLGALAYEAFEYDNGFEEQHTAIINIQDVGNKTWDYNNASFWQKNLKGFFDTSILYGNASKYILEDQMLNLFHTKELSLLSSKQLDFVLVIIGLHDSKEYGKLSPVFSQFPKLAKDTLYIVEGCFSGQYHKFLPNGCHLITSSSDTESSLTSDFDKIVNLSKYVDKSGINLSSFLKFYSNEYVSSTPHYSGNFNDKLVENVPIKELFPAMPYEELNTLSDKMEVKADQFVPVSTKMQVKIFNTMSDTIELSLSSVLSNDVLPIPFEISQNFNIEPTGTTNNEELIGEINPIYCTIL